MELRGLGSSVLVPVDGEEEFEEASAAAELDDDDLELPDTGVVRPASMVMFSGSSITLTSAGTGDRHCRMNASVS